MHLSREGDLGAGPRAAAMFYGHARPVYAAPLQPIPQPVAKLWIGGEGRGPGRIAKPWRAGSRLNLICVLSTLKTGLFFYIYKIL